MVSDSAMTHRMAEINRRSAGGHDVTRDGQGLAGEINRRSKAVGSDNAARDQAGQYYDQPTIKRSATTMHLGRSYSSVYDQSDDQRRPRQRCNDGRNGELTIKRGHDKRIYRTGSEINRRSG
jgi:hypothetical protein